MKRAIITGASKGIGRAISYLLAKNGFLVGALARSKEILSNMREDDNRIMPIICDVTDEKGMKAAVDDFMKAHDTIEALINCAGYARHKPFTQYSVEDWKTHIDVNLNGMFLAIRYVLPYMLKQGYGDIVNISSMSGKLGHPGGSAYCASKHAVHGFSKSILAEVREKGIRVTTIYPGSTDTGMLKENIKNLDARAAIKVEDIAVAVLHVLNSPKHVIYEEINLTPAKSVIVNTIR